MKTINLLKNLINILFWGMILFSILGFILIIYLFISPESLPLMFQGYRMLFDSDFPWQIWISPLSYVLGFLLFIVSIYYLKKCIRPFQERRFYSEEVIENLKKAGRLFIFIALGTSLIRIIAALAFNTYANISVIGGSFGSGQTSLAVLSAIGNINFFLLIIGLFLLVFSSAFENGKFLKEENDLTI
ncbi:DUF2975 domain-containing protein [Winogradskyella sp. A3E31]|uniref:DUF2975 domain-containing protein n=1 Tax=Winogradskyella sp. A3E31 TaxID=3349637 RepID=UPI00398B4B2E